MSSLSNALRGSSRSRSALPRASTSSVYAYGRSPAYRRLLSASSTSSSPSRTRTPLHLASSPASTSRLLFDFDQTRIPASTTLLRSFHASAPAWQQQEADKGYQAPRQRAKPSQPEQPVAQDPTQSASGSNPVEPQTDTKPSEPASETTSDATEDAAKEQEKKTEDGEQKTDEKESKDGKKDAPPPPPPPHGDKTPWQVFMDTMQSEFKQSKEWNESTKALSSSAHDFTESESVRRARQVYESTSGTISSTASTVVKSTAGAIGKGAAWTWETPVVKGVRKAANTTGDVLDKATKPIRDTEAYKNVKDVIDDGSSSRYGGWVEKEERRKKREAQRLTGKPEVPENFEEDPNAGTNVTLHKDAAWKEAWRDFRDQNKFVQGVFSMKSVYQESENPLISTARSITDRVAGFFAENETAMVIKKFRTMDPNFQVEPFLRDLREYILPEVLDAYVTGDIETLRLWLSEAQYSVYEALTKQYLQAGMKSDGRILDIRHVDIVRARMLDPGEIPVFVITCRTQEVHVYRNAKTNELAAGMEDKVQLVTYAIGITRVPEDVSNPETRGWRLIEMQKSGRDWY